MDEFNQTEQTEPTMPEEAGALLLTEGSRGNTLNILPLRLLPFFMVRLLFSAAMLWHSTRYDPSGKEQVAIVAEQIIDANHAQKEQCRFVTAPDA